MKKSQQYGASKVTLLNNVTQSLLLYLSGYVVSHSVPSLALHQLSCQIQTLTFKVLLTCSPGYLMLDSHHTLVQSLDRASSTSLFPSLTTTSPCYSLQLECPPCLLNTTWVLVQTLCKCEVHNSFHPHSAFSVSPASWLLPSLPLSIEVFGGEGSIPGR